MKTKTAHKYLLLSFCLLSFTLLTSNCFAQAKTENEPQKKKTITMHVTKDDDGTITVIDTTVVTDTDFDADAFLLKKGVNDKQMDEGKHVVKKIVIVKPGSKSITYSEDASNKADTVLMADGQIIILKGKPDLQGLESIDEDMEFDNEMPDGHGHFQGPMCEQMMKGMMKEYGLDAFMPFGEMKKIVVKKKHHGKKLIITFEDREDACCGHKYGDKR